MSTLSGLIYRANKTLWTDGYVHSFSAGSLAPSTHRWALAPHSLPPSFVRWDSQESWKTRASSSLVAMQGSAGHVDAQGGQCQSPGRPRCLEACVTLTPNPGGQCQSPGRPRCLKACVTLTPNQGGQCQSPGRPRCLKAGVPCVAWRVRLVTTASGTGLTSCRDRTGCAVDRDKLLPRRTGCAVDRDKLLPRRTGCAVWTGLDVL